MGQKRTSAEISITSARCPNATSTEPPAQVAFLAETGRWQNVLPACYAAKRENMSKIPGRNSISASTVRGSGYPIICDGSNHASSHGGEAEGDQSPDVTYRIITGVAWIAQQSDAPPCYAV